MKRKISAEIIADSIDTRGNRITSYILTYPRFIHSELMTHRMFSRNSASSRAIPFEKMLKLVEEDPFIPIAWQKDHKGMQGTEYHTDEYIISGLEYSWLNARDNAVRSAIELGFFKTSKQILNRLLEPFLWHTVLVTATHYDNFFDLRCPKYQWQDGEVFKSWKDLVSDSFKKGGSRDWVDGLESTSQLERIKHSKSGAEIHIQALAEAMWDAKNESTPKLLKENQWHIPFGDQIDLSKIREFESGDKKAILGLDLMIKVAVARAARLSYSTHDGEIDYEKDIKLHDQLYKSKHYSCFEHCVRVMSDKEYYSFIKGVVPTQVDEFGITNLEMMPYSTGHPIVGFKGLNKNNGDKYGWCNNFRGFIPYRYMLENERT